MGIVRKTATYSLSSPGLADANPSRKRSNGVLADDGPVKNSRLDEPQTQVAAANQPEMSTTPFTVSALPSAGALPIRPVVGSLEHYRLKSPASLPTADAQGLRIFNGRQYVDIAHDEIVQVRQTAATGEYRATLASELAASGPALIFDPQNRLWKLAAAQPSSDLANVIDIDIDELIRGIRNESTAKKRIHDGSEDMIERDTLIGATLVARGLKQFKPKQAALIRSELRAIETVFSDANYAISQNLHEADAVYTSFFGADHRVVAGQFAESVSRGLALSREYQGVWGEEKFIGVDVDNDAAAWMYKRDFHGRFFINRKYMRRGILSMSLGHEMLHTNRVDRFQAIGPNAADFFYLSNHLQGLLSPDLPSIYDVPERGVSEAIMRGGLTVDYLKAFGDDHDSFLFGVSDYLGVDDDLDLHTAVELFNANSQMRAHMAANNADSVVYAAKSLQTLQRNKIEYAWLDSLIED
ncbi:hypothetical protein CLU80_0619 [Pseudomonas sp. 29]|uniref:hypothetical protein n=1 Tax=Pseudomonas sp. 29 TaxID=2035197 RepID=UPI000C5EA281|nr:hypothetical protein [Pseudomonas sp. 29]PIF48371.1 hypothetical protein CLU80_0619 [Pseudomonas sp. 29]